MKKQVKKILSLIMLVVLLLATVVNAADSNLQLDATTGSLTINKALDGTIFEIYKVADDEIAKSLPTDSDVVNTKQSGEIKDGKVVFSNLDLGRYLVVEASAPEGSTGKVANFLVDIPMTEPGETADKLIYDIQVTPKDNTAYGEITLTNYGIVLGADNSKTPLSDSTFKFQKNIDGTWTDMTEDVLTTDSNGQIVVSGLDAGEYRFVQQSVENGYILNQEILSFNVSSNDDGTTLVYPSDLSITNYKPQITKEITTTLVESDGKGSAKIGDTISYQIVAYIPDVIADLNTFEITDIIPEGLTLDTSSVAIEFDMTLNPVSIIEEETEYSVDFDETTRKLTVTCNTSNLYDWHNTIIITYDAEVNENISASSTGNINTATLEYSIVTKTDYEGNTNTDITNTISDDATVYTSGFWIEKRAESTTGELLSGAVFKLAATEDDAKAGTYLKDTEGNEITITTDGNGKASYKGLTYGTYYLVETKAPTYVDESTGATKSYNLLRKPQAVTIDDETYESTTPTGIIVNKKGLELPGTGSMGTLIITVIGIAIILIGTKVTKQTKSRRARH